MLKINLEPIKKPTGPHTYVWWRRATLEYEGTTYTVEAEDYTIRKVAEQFMLSNPEKGALLAEVYRGSQKVFEARRIADFATGKALQTGNQPEHLKRNKKLTYSSDKKATH